MTVLLEHLLSVLSYLLPFPYLGLLLPPPAGESYALQEIILALFRKGCKFVDMEMRVSIICDKYV